MTLNSLIVIWETSFSPIATIEMAIGSALCLVNAGRITQESPGGCGCGSALRDQLALSDRGSRRRRKDRSAPQIWSLWMQLLWQPLRREADVLPQPQGPGQGGFSQSWLHVQIQGSVFLPRSRSWRSLWRPCVSCPCGCGVRSGPWAGLRTGQCFRWGHACPPGLPQVSEPWLPCVRHLVCGRSSFLVLTWSLTELTVFPVPSPVH